MAKQFEDLTTEQEALLDVYADRWIAIGLCTDPADRAVAEAAIPLIYAAAEPSLDPPERIEWVGSPAAARDRCKELGVDFACLYGQHDASWLSGYDYCREVLGMAEAELVAGHIQYAKAAGWMVPLDELAICCERHNVVRTDAAHRAHAEDGMAIQYPDGWGVCVWHGTTVPDKWILERDKLTPQEVLGTANTEVRRAGCEILGWDRILAETGAKVLDSHENPFVGELLSVDLPDAPASKMLRVLCGTGRTFVIPVDDNTRSAEEAQSQIWDCAIDEIPTRRT